MKAGLTPVLRAALVELLADALARRGKCYLPTVGTFYLDEDSDEVEFVAEKALKDFIKTKQEEKTR